MKLYYPVKKHLRINQKFGQNANPFYAQLGMKGHNGWDIFALDGDPVYAAHDGVVTFTGYDGGGGLGVVIRGEDGEEKFKTIYWHLKKDSIRVLPDQVVKTGDLIALADNTGMSTGSHLHFGLKFIEQGEQPWIWDNVNQNNGYRGAVDPEPYWTGEYAVDQKIMSIQNAIIGVLRQLISLLSKK